MTAALSIAALLRGLHLAGLLLLLGTATCRWLILPADAGGDAALARRLRWLDRVAVVLAVPGGIAWLVTEAQAVSGARSLTDTLAVLPLVITGTRFGRVMLLRLGLLLPGIALAARARGAVPGALLLLGAAAMQGLFGHAGAAAGAVGNGLVVSEACHLVAAGVWVGALPALFLALGRLPADAAVAMCERFTPVGLAAVLVLAASGALQAISLIGGLAGLLGTPYGQLAMLKIALFLVALALAALNRLWLTDRLARTGSARALRLSVGIETAIGFAIVLTAGLLASTAPAADTGRLSWRDGPSIHAAGYGPFTGQTPQSAGISYLNWPQRSPLSASARPSHYPEANNEHHA